MGSYKIGLGSLWERTLCAMVFRACATPIAHGVGSYKRGPGSLWERTLCAMVFWARATLIDHGVGSYRGVICEAQHVDANANKPAQVASAPRLWQGMRRCCRARV